MARGCPWLAYPVLHSLKPRVPFSRNGRPRSAHLTPSQPTIAAYEAGRKSPTLRTLSHLAEVAGLEATIGFHRPMTREERRSLHLHRAIARRLERCPELVLARARNTLSLMRENHPEAERLFLEWDVILSRPVSEMAPALTDPSPWSRELRQVTPFAGVLTGQERTEVYRTFRKVESR